MITGAGWLADELAGALADFDVVVMEPGTLDITSRLMCYQVVDRLRPAIIIHTAGDDNLDSCQIDPGLSYRFHVVGTRNIIKAATRVGAKIVYPSTAYVFSGEEDNVFVEEDFPCPQTILGQTKFWAERMVMNSRPDSLVVRSSWLYGKGNMGLFWAVEGLLDRDIPAKIVADQVLSPTYGRDYAQKVGELIRARACGIYHVANQGVCTVYQLVRRYLDLSGRGDEPTYPLAVSDLKLPAPRPCSLALASTQLKIQGISLRPWEQALANCIQRGEHRIMPDPKAWVNQVSWI